MFSPNVRFLLLICLSFCFISCSLFEEEEEDPYADRHPDFTRKEDFFIKAGFRYHDYNLNGYEGVQRSRKELDSHRPQVKFEEDGGKIILSFPNHPHEPKHYWAWFEVLDKNGVEFYEEVDEPSEAVGKFEFVVIPEEPVKHKIRVRAFCHVHGEFEDYVIVPEFSEKSIIDR